jgi:ribosome-binding factor A
MLARFAMPRDRPARVAQLIQEELGKLLVRGFKDPRITGFVTITGVKVSPDLKLATIYYSVHGEPKVIEETTEGLKASIGYIKREIGRDLKLRHTPDLRFIFDEAIERGDRIERLLKEVKEQDAARTSEPEGEG